MTLLFNIKDKLKDLFGEIRIKIEKNIKYS